MILQKLRRLRAGITHPVAALFFLCPSIGAAATWDLEDFRNDSRRTVYGFLGGLVAHELGHISVATASGIDFEFDGPSIVYPEPGLSDSERLRVASAGIQLQWMASEIAFHYLGGARNSVATRNAAAGLIVSHLAITAAYFTVLKGHAEGDVEGISEVTGLSNDQIALALALPAVLDGWRLFGNAPGWVPKLSLLTKGLGIAWAWSY